MAEAKGYRCEVTLTELTYRGDRDERVTVFTVSGANEASSNLAIENALRSMERLGYSIPIGARQ